MTRFHSRSDRGFREKLYQSLPRFLAYCAIMRACRSLPQVRRFKPVVVGLVMPEGADMDMYEDGARYAAHGPSIINGGFDSTEVVTRKGGRNSRFEDPDLAKSLARRRRVFLLAASDGSMPDIFDLAADAVVEVGPVLPRHVIAGAKLCLRLNVTSEQAAFIATVPLPVIVSAMRRGRPVSAAIALMKKAVAPKPKDVSGPTLDDLHGLGEAGEWGRELATDLADWQAGKIGWSDVDRGILLSGPPGTGKTTFAGALARTCKVHLVLGSIGRWQAKGHLGDMLKAMRAAFDEARRNAPSIIFLDEIDAVGDRERFSDHNAQYCTEVVAALLECIDGAEGREGVVVVGACNHPDRLDAALVRAGRLDRHVRISLPDAMGREGILRWHLQGLLAKADLSEIAARTEGWNGASLEQLVRQARRLARRARRDMRQSAARIEDPHLVRQVRPQIPKHQIQIIRFSAWRETRHKNAGNTSGLEPIIHGPRRRPVAIGKGCRPCTGHLVKIYRMLAPALLRRQVGDILAVDVVGAKHTGTNSMRKALVYLLDRRHDTQAEIEGRNTLRVEARTPNRCALARHWLEGPTRIMRSIAGPYEPHANPPRAM